MAQLSLRDVRKNFKGTEVLRGIDLEIGDRELVVFVGPSGCGKSTLLRMIAGLDDMSGGEFLLNGVSMREVPPSKRGIAMVFQSYALYPHMDVYENMAFGARLQGLDKAEVENRIQDAAKMLRLEPLLRRKPRELSGGQRQRVAIGRALVRKPEVFLLDEPLSNLDAALRSDVRLEIAKLHQDIGGTMIYVTHDQVEAMTLADKIVVMNAGRIEQVGSPRELYETPANTFVATFIGSPRMTLIDAVRMGDEFAVAGSGAVALAGAPASGAQVKLGVRPDAFGIVTDGPGYRAEFVYSEYLGNDAYVYARLGDGTLVSVRTDPAPRSERPGDVVLLRPDPAAVHFFDGESGQRL
ncbi:ATP-binding protein of mannitol ABC transporter [Ketogulonicigenium robustum]|uniref:ATP-binding protein of mannitol ABC transporter n=1 Tax=Ketogulonicigenium robustum TaxID=92947 RepID=A0A1W6P230_9RHOB|nr:ABC transporter ATP-binding protein [Ketogulonicigenium robustum]ARO15473.1 ATP-binding protein of mannitol ABC transporter [Ketogulonicigenium robustum]